MKIGVLASHEGTMLQAIIDACTAGALAATVVTVISNNRDAGALHRARAAGIRVHHLSSRTHAEAEALDAAFGSTRKCLSKLGSKPEGKLFRIML